MFKVFTHVPRVYLDIRDKSIHTHFPKSQLQLEFKFSIKNWPFLAFCQQYVNETKGLIKTQTFKSVYVQGISYKKKTPYILYPV